MADPLIAKYLAEYYKSRYEISISSIENTVFESMVMGLNLMNHGFYKQAQAKIKLMGLMKALPQLYLDYATYCDEEKGLQYIDMAVSLDGRLERAGYPLKGAMGWKG